MIISTLLETNKGIYYSSEYNTVDTLMGVVSSYIDSLNYAQMMKLIGVVSIYDIHMDYEEPLKFYTNTVGNFNNREGYVIQEKLLNHLPRISLLEYTYTHIPSHQKRGTDNIIYTNKPLTLVSNTGICSFITHSSHILLLDFSCPVTDENTELLKKELPKGLLVNSGNSYHFYGYEVLDFATWQARMHAALLLHGIDHRYIGHRLLDGYGTLRITPNDHKPHTPEIICEIP